MKTASAKSIIMQCLASALLGMVATATHAAMTAPWKMTGALKATVCQIELQNDGLVDFGEILRGQLSPSASVGVDAKPFSATVQCDSPTLVALKITDNRPASSKPNRGMNFQFKQPGSGALAINLAPIKFFSLGSTSGQPIAALAIRMNKVSVTDATGTLTSSHLMTGPARDSLTSRPYVDTSSGHLIAPSNNTVLISGTRFVFPMELAASIEKGGNVPSNADIELKGSAIVEVIYL
ncbi:DUF1120 domain-containing protein [Herbaspirillum sp. RTI4]|uniref:DUF1120 domain-containing protein n=1 Tax=Herbaspirillum sp. RTI4 TaxID=3048640 RepID=UPI002AB49A49|nr:DUF1120 domain-containing protein [Herbaspirillum sp. RTI4]MDY7577722.1 DUF1120 domain-containing protein [Herbaspirillum sp. RTI4]MEA9980850.1 DUF1120 domain-containing protein [Herbaspirillum sp. RTI4]